MVDDFSSCFSNKWHHHDIIAIAKNYLYVLANFLIISDSQLTS